MTAQRRRRALVLTGLSLAVTALVTLSVWGLASGQVPPPRPASPDVVGGIPLSELPRDPQGRVAMVCGDRVTGGGTESVCRPLRIGTDVQLEETPSAVPRPSEPTFPAPPGDPPSESRTTVVDATTTTLVASGGPPTTRN